MSLALESLDQLIDDLRHALTTSNWSEVARLNARIRPTVVPVMAAMEAGDVEARVVNERLDDLQTLVCEAGLRAKAACSEIKDSLAALAPSGKDGAV